MARWCRAVFLSAVLIVFVAAAAFVPDGRAGRRDGADGPAEGGPVGVQVESAARDRQQKGKDRGHIQLYTGYGTPERILVHGRVLEGKPYSMPQGKGSVLGNVARTLKMLETDEIPDRPVTVLCAGRKATAVTDSEGFFRIPVECGARPFRPGEIPVKIEVKLSPNGSIETRGIVLVYPQALSRVIVCDFDDTLCQTGMDKKLSAAWKMLARDPARMKPVPSMSEFLRALAAAEQNAKQPTPVFYVSGGPVNFHPRISAFLRRHSFPAGVLMLRNLGLGSANDPLSVQKYKTQRIGSLLATFERGQFILIGDSGEKDPEIYAALRKKHPDRIGAIMIRQMGQTAKKGSRFDRMILFKDGADALSAAVEEGLIKAQGAPEERAAPAGPRPLPSSSSPPAEK